MNRNILQAFVAAICGAVTGTALCILSGYGPQWILLWAGIGGVTGFVAYDPAALWKAILERSEGKERKGLKLHIFRTDFQRFFLGLHKVAGCVIVVLYMFLPFILGWLIIAEVWVYASGRPVSDEMFIPSASLLALMLLAISDIKWTNGKGGKIYPPIRYLLFTFIVQKKMTGFVTRKMVDEPEKAEEYLIEESDLLLLPPWKYGNNFISAKGLRARMLFALFVGLIPVYSLLIFLVFALDAVLAALIACACTKRLAAMTGGAIGAVAGSFAHFSGFEPLISLAVASLCAVSVSCLSISLRFLCERIADRLTPVYPCN